MQCSSIPKTSAAGSSVTYVLPSSRLSHSASPERREGGDVTYPTRLCSPLLGEMTIVASSATSTSKTTTSISITESHTPTVDRLLFLTFVSSAANAFARGRTASLRSNVTKTGRSASRPPPPSSSWSGSSSTAALRGRAPAPTSRRREPGAAAHESHSSMPPRADPLAAGASALGRLRAMIAALVWCPPGANFGSTKHVRAV